MKSGVIRTLVASLLFCGASPRGAAFTCDKIVGHEDLTAFAIAEANTTLAGLSLLTAFQYPAAALGVRATEAANPLVRGNFATDHAEKVPEISLASFYGLPADQLLGYSSEHMDLHGIRNFRTEGGELVADGAATSCQRGHIRIKAAAREAAAAWHDDPARALFFAGHATHPIQDSFSQAHSRRSADQRQLLDVCTWKGTAPGACTHSDWFGLDFDPDDIIWGPWITCAFSRTVDCLKPEAAAAVKVTAGFLVALAQLADVKADAATVDARLETWLSTDDGSPGSGYFACDKL